jgi:hypothetical protein
MPASPPPESLSQTEKLLPLSDGDRSHLAEAIQELLAHGSILGLDNGQLPLYNWCRQHFEWLREIAALTGLDIAILHDERMVQAIPRISSIILNLRQDATLVWLALWYAADMRWRDQGETQAFLSITELNSLLKEQLLPDASGQISRSRLREILRQAARYNLIRLQLKEPFEESEIEILPAIRRIVPFRSLNEWQEAQKNFHKNPPIIGDPEQSDNGADSSPPAPADPDPGSDSGESDADGDPHFIIDHPET